MHTREKLTNVPSSENPSLSRTIILNFRSLKFGEDDSTTVTLPDGVFLFGVRDMKWWIVFEECFFLICWYIWSLFDTSTIFNITFSQLSKCVFGILWILCRVFRPFVAPEIKSNLAWLHRQHGIASSLVRMPRGYEDEPELTWNRGKNSPVPDIRRVQPCTAHFQLPSTIYGCLFGLFYKVTKDGQLLYVSLPKRKAFIHVGKDNKNTYDGSMIGVPGGGGSELVEKGMFL